VVVSKFAAQKQSQDLPLSTMPDEELLHVPSRDGARIAVWRSGRGRPLVLVHGTSVDHRDWAPVLPALRSRYTVYAVDRRGLGASEDPPEYSPEREFEDVAAVVEAIGEPCGLAGHSFGALCSLEAARLTPNLRKLVLYEPPIPTGPDFHPPDIIERLEGLLQTGQRDEVVATFMREVAEHKAERVERQRRSPGWAFRAAAAHTVVRETRCTHFYALEPERFRDVQVPTLLLLGGASSARHVAATTAVASVLSDVRVAVLPGQTHLAVRTAPQLFLDEVLCFLDMPD